MTEQLVFEVDAKNVTEDEWNFYLFVLDYNFVPQHKMAKKSDKSTFINLIFWHQIFFLFI